jgi:hypothetical protein
MDPSDPWDMDTWEQQSPLGRAPHSAASPSRPTAANRAEPTLVLTRKGTLSGPAACLSPRKLLRAGAVTLHHISPREPVVQARSLHVTEYLLPSQIPESFMPAWRHGGPHPDMRNEQPPTDMNTGWVSCRDPPGASALFRSTLPLLHTSSTARLFALRRPDRAALATPPTLGR